MIIFHKCLEGIRNYNKDKNNPEFKKYEPYQGRMDLSEFIEIFNFENNIYPDKQFSYSQISNLNKRLIPEIMSGAFASLIYHNYIIKDIRLKLEQFLIAIMSNLDYKNYANVELFEKEVNTHKGKSFFMLLGSTPETFKYNKEDYKYILKKRIKVLCEIVNKFFNNKDYIYIYKNDNFIDTETVNSFIKISNVKGYPIIKKLEEEKIKNKFTSNNINSLFSKVFEYIKKNRNESINLFIVTSTFNISKVCIEIEKYFYDSPNLFKDKILNNISNTSSDKMLTDCIESITIVGDKTFFELMTYDSGKKTSAKQKILRIKEMQSFLFEIFMHALDRNKNK